MKRLTLSRCRCRRKPADEQILMPIRLTYLECVQANRIRYSNRSVVVMLSGPAKAEDPAV
jgi:hypothetical protein